MEGRKKGEEESKRLFFFSFACDALAHFSNLFIAAMIDASSEHKCLSQSALMNLSNWQAIEIKGSDCRTFLLDGPVR